VGTIFGFVIIALAGAGAFFLTRKQDKTTLLERLNLQLYLVRLPRVSKEGKELQKEIALFEQLLNSLASLGKPVVFELAVPSVGEEIHFYAAAPKPLAQTLARQIHALWNGAEVEEAPDYTIFNSNGVFRGAYFREREKFILPLRTYKDTEGDPFSSILGAFTKVREIGEGAALQIVFIPAPRQLRTKITSALRRLQKGEPLWKIMRSSFSVENIIEVVSPSESKDKKAEQTMGPKQVEELAVQALQKKASSPLFRANVRLLASAGNAEEAEAILGGLLAGFSQFGAPHRNELKVIRPERSNSLAHSFSFREFDSRGEMLLNSEEIASMFHFPTPFTETPRVKALKSIQAPPPPNLAREGVLLGESVYRGERKEVKVSDDDRRRHIYIIGQTGTGKSNLITQMSSQDAIAGKGLAIIDPHGDLVNAILRHVPRARAEDVILFDPSDLERPMGINMLEYNLERPEEKTFIVNEMVSIFDKLYDLKITGGPMFEQYMRNALLLLMEDMKYEPATLMEVPRVFTDASYRKRKLERIRNPTVVDFWQKEAEKAGGEASLQNITPYITSKFNTFTANDYMRVIIGQERSSFNFRQVMDEGKILLVNLSKGRIGDINANLLGMIFVGKILMAALSRVDISEESRRDFNLYIDEFQNFTTDSIATILSEARKYHLNLVVAHQFIAQLSEKIRDAVFGNVGSIVSFRVGVQDTEVLKKEFEPVFGEHDLSNIDNFNAYVRLLVGGQTTAPFNIRTLPLPAGDSDIGARIQEASRARYGRAKEEVEESIYRRLRD
ncbi:MAG: DUF87 domain-containing protein, partial [Patescibacteria group bacterium]